MDERDCDLCGRRVRRGRILHSGKPFTPDNRIGIYGRDCARKIIVARLKDLHMTYTNGPAR